ncbi:unnamed protein product [Auanema sp. JU1783]|nr:unnamed protein product [Auanema sp. JU1783]
MTIKQHDSTPVGVTRNITEVFSLLRNNAQQSKFYSQNKSSRSRNVPEERMSLVSLEDGEDNSASTTEIMWIHTCDEIEFDFGRIRSRIEELAAAQQKHISRPNFGDEAFEAEEKRMEGLTEQITSMMSHCQRLIGMMSSQVPRRETKTEKQLRDNAVSSLVFTLSELTNEFRTRQAKYLNDIKKRRSEVNNFLITMGSTEDSSWEGLLDNNPSQEYTMDQIQTMMMNDQEVKEREAEVLSVNSSIRDLNNLFKDLSSMVIDQGTILDRIDYNVEQVSMRVGNAVTSVRKAESSQRKDKKMHCIFMLAIAILFVLLLLIFSKF